MSGTEAVQETPPNVEATPQDGLNVLLATLPGIRSMAVPQPPITTTRRPSSMTSMRPLSNVAHPSLHITTPSSTLVIAAFPPPRTTPPNLPLPSAPKEVPKPRPLGLNLDTAYGEFSSHDRSKLSKWPLADPDAPDQYCKLVVGEQRQMFLVSRNLVMSHALKLHRISEDMKRHGGRNQNRDINLYQIDPPSVRYFLCWCYHGSIFTNNTSRASKEVVADMVRLYIFAEWLEAPALGNDACRAMLWRFKNCPDELPNDLKSVVKVAHYAWKKLKPQSKLRTLMIDLLAYGGVGQEPTHWIEVLESAGSMPKEPMPKDLRSRLHSRMNSFVKETVHVGQGPSLPLDNESNYLMPE